MRPAKKKTLLSRLGIDQFTEIVDADTEMTSEDVDYKKIIVVAGRACCKCHAPILIDTGKLRRTPNGYRRQRVYVCPSCLSESVKYASLGPRELLQTVVSEIAIVASALRAKNTPRQCPHMDEFLRYPAGWPKEGADDP